MGRPMSVQLFSVRHELAKDFLGTLKKMKEIGYEGVEFFGPYSRPAIEVKAALKETGLFAAGWHTGWDCVATDEALYKTIAYNAVVGNDYIVVPGLPHEMTTTKDGWLKVGARMNEIAEILKDYGMHIGYHNHDAEFRPVEGENPWDTLMGTTCKCVVGQYDVGNAMHGDADTMYYLNKYAGRTKSIHLKPYGTKGAGFDVMAGDADDDAPWAEILLHCDKYGTVQYIIEYENENYPDAVEGVAECLKALRKLGY